MSIKQAAAAFMAVILLSGGILARISNAFKNIS